MRIRLIISCLFAFSSTQTGCEILGPSEIGFADTPGPILFVSAENGTSQLYSIWPDGSRVRQITDDPDFQIVDAVWSPDGDWIMLVEYRRTGLHSPVNFLHLADKRGNRVHSCKDLVGRDPVWSPDSQKIVYGVGLAYYRQYIIDIQDCVPRPLQGTINTGTRTTITDWSDNGRLILGDSDLWNFGDGQDKAGANIRLSIWEVDGDSLYTIGRRGIQYTNPIWSSDEEYIAFSILRDHERRIYISSSDGQNQRVLTGPGYQTIVPVSWSEDDTKILVGGWSKDTRKSSILMVDVKDGTIEDLTPFPDASCGPTSWLHN